MRVPLLRRLRPLAEPALDAADWGVRPNADVTAALQGALDRLRDSGGGTLLLPDGTYYLSAPVTLGRYVTLIGQSPHACVVHALHPGTLFRLEGADTDYPHNELYPGLQGLTLIAHAESNAPALLVRGHRSALRDLAFRGGNAIASQCWAIEFDMANVFHAENIHIGNALAGANWLGHGIRFRNSASRPVNYGDGYIELLDIRLSADNRIGLYFEGPENGHLINNITVDKANIVAPGRTNCTAIQIKNSRRLVFVQVDIEAITNGIVEHGRVGANGAFSEHNSYVCCYCINVTTPYQDNNDGSAYKVRRRIFIGCDNLPDFTNCTDPDARVFDGDDVLQQAVWLQDPVSGRPAFRFGAYTDLSGCYLTDGARSNGVANSHPRGGIRFVVDGNNPRIEPSDSGPTSGNDVWLFLGRNDKTMRGVRVDCPLVIATAPSGGPVSPFNGMLVYADGTTWNPGQGAGLYFREGGVWKKISMS